MATDFSPVAVHIQQHFAGLAPQTMFADWSSFVEGNPPIEKSGRFDVVEHDFVVGSPPGVFDVVINCRAFQGLSPSAMRAAAKHFFAVLRPGGAAIIDTINVQRRACDVLEDSLMDAGFFLPFSASERWYRNQLENTGIAYGKVLGRPHLRHDRRHPLEHFKGYEERDREILASFRTEYETRHAAEESFVEATMRQPETIVAYVVYNTG
jgi:SAM-dependent methyltransferase